MSKKEQLEYHINRMEKFERSDLLVKIEESEADSEINNLSYDEKENRMMMMGDSVNDWVSVQVSGSMIE